MHEDPGAYLLFLTLCFEDAWEDNERTVRDHNIAKCYRPLLAALSRHPVLLTALESYLRAPRWRAPADEEGNPNLATSRMRMFLRVLPRLQSPHRITVISNVIAYPDTFSRFDEEALTMVPTHTPHVTKAACLTTNLHTQYAGSTGRRYAHGRSI